MAAPTRALTVEGAREHIRERCLQPSTSPCVGLEAEWHVVRVGRAEENVALDEIQACLDGVEPLQGASRITYEPGGQVELSTAPADGVRRACDALATDHGVVADRLRANALELRAVGMDPVRSPARVLAAPRYAAMEAYFDSFGPDGRWMMSRTAALQVNVDNGPPATMARRWRVAHAIGPALVAAFANSPLRAGTPTGWRSNRLATWLAMDPSRTTPVLGSDRPTWDDYALGARVMLVRVADGGFVPMKNALTFGCWIELGAAVGFPTLDDLDYHLTTLFPPVRARGWLELRYLDALPDPWWRVAAAVTTALITDDAAAAAAEEATGETAPLWHEAAHAGLDHPALRTSVVRLVDAALDALDRLDVDALTASSCHDFADRYTRRGRCPGDDLLDLVAAGKEPRWP